MKFAIIGAGFSGSVLARELAASGHMVEIFEARSHIAGNCYSKRDEETNIITHQYGPHIFHTDDTEVWEYVNKYSTFESYVNRVKVTVKDRVYSLPINLFTINQFFEKNFSPDEAKSFIKSLTDTSILEPVSFEDQALKFIGKELYEAFFKGYTLKQWGMHPRELPASILKRLPVRFNYDDNYFTHQYQGMPTNGYTEIVESIINHPNINLKLNSKFDSMFASKYNHVFYTGPIDAWYKFEFGRLGYRTLDFEVEVHEGDYQGCAVMNYGDQGTPYTRISEHKHFSPWEEHEKTIIFKEYSRQCDVGDIPYYPIRLLHEKDMLKRYLDKANQSNGVSFLGRLGTYRYLDMDVTIREALDASRETLRCIEHGNKIPAFFVDPL